MVKAALTRTCAYQPCGKEFYANRPYQRYCSYEHSDQSRIEKRPNRGGKKGPKPKTPRFTAITILLPAGCNPIRSVALPVAPESTERLGGGQAYGEIARRIWCARYERCLSHAVSKNWQGFECTKCDIDEPDINAPRPKGTNWEW